MSAIRPYNTDYTGRSLDLEVLQGVEVPEGVYELDLSATSKSSRYVTGLQKLAQRYTIVLLSELGHSFGDPEFGTNFWSSAVRGALRNEGYMRSVFEYANILALRQMQAEDENYPDTPDDEKVASATLVDISVDSRMSQAYFAVDLRSVAGDSHTYKVPVTLLEREHGS